MLKIVIILSLFSMLWADRCNNYKNDVRKAHFRVFGVSFPYWYGIAQLKQESGCRDVISRDGIGSQGLAQITYRWWKPFLNKKGIYNIRSARNQTLAQAYIMADAKKQSYTSHLFGAYMVYNGGNWINKEITRARKDLGIREVPHQIAQLYCTRKKMYYGKTACEINYEYPVKIYKYAQKWKMGSDEKWIFW